MKAIPWYIDSSGGVGGFEFHDGTLNGLLMLNDALWLFVTNLSKESVLMKLSGIDRLNVSDFLEGNIILDISFFDKRGSKDYDLDELFKIDLLPGETYSEACSRVRECLNKYSAKNIFRLVSSYGATVYAVCEAMAVFSYIGKDLIAVALGALESGAQVDKES